MARKLIGTNPMDLNQLTDSTLGLAQPTTIFHDYLFTTGTFRAHLDGDLQNLNLEIYETDRAAILHIIPQVRTVVEEMGLSKYVQAISFIRENATVMNDSLLTDHTYKIIRQWTSGKDVFLSDGQVPNFNDAFVYFQQKILGVYFFLGEPNLSKGIIAMNHSSNFQIDDVCLKSGVGAFAYLLSRILAE